MTQPIIDAQDLSKKVGQRYLLKDITWQVQPGEHWCIFGLNGCGKTTLLSILAGFQQPTSGKLSILGPVSYTHLDVYKRQDCKQS